MTKNGLKIVKRKKPQTTADSFIRDGRLSLKAKGLMSLVLSLPKDWEFSIPGLLSTMNEGKASVYGALGELRKYGYCEYETKRDDKGKMAGTEYVFYEVSTLNKGDEPHPDYPHTEKRDTENPHPDNPHPENQNAKGIEDIKGEDLIVPPYNPPKGYEQISFDFVDEGFWDILFDWLEFKNNKRQRYKDEKSLKLLYGKLIKLSDGNPEKARRIVEESMANNWSGLFELKDNNTRGAKKPDDTRLKNNSVDKFDNSFKSWSK